MKFPTPTALYPASDATIIRLGQPGKWESTITQGIDPQLVYSSTNYFMLFQTTQSKGLFEKFAVSYGIELPVMKRFESSLSFCL